MVRLLAPFFLLLALAACTQLQDAIGPSFDLSLGSSSLTVYQSEGKKVNLTITPKNNFSGTVSLSLVNPPVGVSLSPSSVTVGSSPKTQELTISTTGSTPVGQHTLTLQGTAGSVQKSVTLTLVVNQPQVFNVNTTDDTIDNNPGDGQCRDSNNNCSLRAAIMEANALAAPAVIELPAGTYTLTRTSSIDEQGYDLDLKTNITLRGAGRDTTVLDGNNTTRVIEVHPDKNVTLENLTVQKAPLYQNNTTVAAIWNNEGQITLRNVVVQNNGGVGIYNGFGAAIDTGRARLFMQDVLVQNNGGTGVYVNSGTATLINVTIRENQGRGLTSGGTAVLTDTTISGNQNGGFYNSGGAATLTNVTISGNSAQYGGGFYNYGTATLTNVTISGNTATGFNAQGGGVYSTGYGSTLKLSFSTITNNTAPRGGGLRIDSGTVELKGVILSGNTATSGTGPECEGSLTSRGYNLIKSNADCAFTSDTTDILNQDANLATLADNGGSVQTHLPNAGSPVLDRVPAASCTDLSNNPLSTDARGVSRPQGSACDIGAVERN